MNPVYIAGFLGSGSVIRTNLETTGPQYTVATDTLVTDNATTITIGAGQYAFFQNLDDAAVYVKLGAGASSSVFSFVLSAGTAANDGLGGSRVIDNYSGSVTFAAATGSPRLIASVLS